ncbi:uncharacterized protein [Amphiura filiformis]|uniref:uncharacterized protein isoform X2 n=1 Tax=Amphiura filiformis TaxID=82378 RepID=UPI003B20DB82
MQRVAVIGAGAAGLSAARYLSAKPNSFEPVVFEKSDRIGGTWVYTGETGIDQYGLPIHSSMYKNLKTNLPKEVMAFPDFPFDSSLPSFVTHKDVLDYLDQYAAQFNLLQYIKFKTVVECVKPVTNGETTLWEVTVRGVTDKANGTQTSVFDAVIVCNGHYSVPKMPKLKGEETFTGTILHSHNYRKPEDFKDSTVVCMGAGYSGQDIVLDLYQQVKMVYLSHWKATLASEFPKNVKQVPTIAHISGSKVVFTDGQGCEADVIILCTGYEYTFPFLTKECRVTVDEDQRISPLYKHLIHAEYPSLSFIGIPIRTVPFPQFSLQARLIIAIFEGSYKLPSKEEIEADNQSDLQKRLDMGWPRRYAHLLPLQWEYNNLLAQLAGTTPIKPVIKNMCKELKYQRENNVWHHKKLNYEIVDEENWRLVSGQNSGDA